MLIRRCAWHLKYHGYRIPFGIASWRGFRLRFTDGLCRRCIARHRAERRAARGIRDDALAPRPRIDGGRVAALMVIGALLCAARPLDQGPTLMSFAPMATRAAITATSTSGPGASRVRRPGGVLGADRRGSAQEVEVASFVRLEHVIQEEPAVAAGEAGRARLPRSPAARQLFIAHP